MDKGLDKRITDFLYQHQGEMAETLFDLVRAPSVQSPAAPGAPYGRPCARVLEKALGICEGYGMRTENHEYRCGSAVYGEGEPEIGIVSHLDVVPAGEGWSANPFEPVLREDGFAVGRGVRDNKNGAVCAIFAARCIRELSIPLRHRLRLIFGCAEETGMDDLPYFLKYHPAPGFSIVPDTAFPVCNGEKGIYTADLLLECGEDIVELHGGSAANVVPDKAYALLPGDLAGALAPCKHISISRDAGYTRIEAGGVSAHASRPQGSVNAVRVLARYLLSQGVQARLGEQSLHALRVIDEALSDFYGERLGIAAQDAPSGRLTCICGLLRLEGRKIRMSLNIRYPVTHDGEAITGALARYAQENGAGFCFDDDDKPSYLPITHPAVKQLCQVYRDCTGKDAEPYVMGGGTYARHLPNAVAFGPDFPQEAKPFGQGRGDCHQPDECQSIKGLIEATRIYVHALAQLDKGLLE